MFHHFYLADHTKVKNAAQNADSLRKKPKHFICSDRERFLHLLQINHKIRHQLSVLTLTSTINLKLEEMFHCLYSCHARLSSHHHGCKFVVTDVAIMVLVRLFNKLFNFSWS